MFINAYTVMDTISVKTEIINKMEDIIYIKNNERIYFWKENDNRYVFGFFIIFIIN